MLDVNKIVYEELESLRKRIIENHIRAGQIASGKTANSMNIVMKDNGGTLFGRKAFSTLENGRNGGKVPKGFYYIIKKWVEDKGIQVENPSTFAYFVSRKIAREGTALFRSGGRNDIYSNEIDIAIKNIQSKIFGEFKTEIKKINQ